MGKKKTTLILDEDLLLAMSAVAGPRQRTRFIEEACRAKLSGPSPELVSGEVLRSRAEGAALASRAVVEAECSSPDQFRAKVAMTVGLIAVGTERWMAGEVVPGIERASDVRTLVTAARGLVELATGVEVLDAVSSLPDDPVVRRELLDDLVARAREAAAGGQRGDAG